jgi:hypothetical protein
VVQVETLHILDLVDLVDLVDVLYLVVQVQEMVQEEVEDKVVNVAVEEQEVDVLVVLVDQDQMV